MSDPGEDHAGPAPNPANQSKQPPARPHVVSRPLPSSKTIGNQKSPRRHDIAAVRRELAAMEEDQSSIVSPACVTCRS